MIKILNSLVEEYFEKCREDNYAVIKRRRGIFCEYEHRSFELTPEYLAEHSEECSINMTLYRIINNEFVIVSMGLRGEWVQRLGSFAATDVDHQGWYECLYFSGSELRFVMSANSRIDYLINELGEEVLLTHDWEYIWGGYSRTHPGSYQRMLVLVTKDKHNNKHFKRMSHIKYKVSPPKEYQKTNGIYFRKSLTD